MKKANHTSLPWRVLHDEGLSQCVYSIDDEPVCQTDFKGKNLNDILADAEFIATACNTHYELIEAAEDLIEAIRHTDIAEPEVESLEQAIAIAKGTTPTREKRTEFEKSFDKFKPKGA